MLFLNLAIGWTLLAEVSSNTFPSLESGPEDLSLYPGENAMFECDLKHTGGFPVTWFHQESGRYLNTDQESAESQNNRFHAAQNKSEESFQLWIMDLQYSDSGAYACVWKGKCAIPMAWFHLTVIGAPTVPASDHMDYSSYHDDDDRPKISTATFDDAEPVCDLTYKSRASENIIDADMTDIVLTCTSPPEMSHSSLEWLRNEDESVAGPFEGNLVYQRYLTPDDREAIFICVLRSPSLKASKNCSVGPVTSFSSANSRSNVSFSKSANGNTSLTSIAAFFGVLCVVLIAILFYIIYMNKKKRMVSYEEVTNVSDAGSVSPHAGHGAGYMSLKGQQQQPKYQPLKMASNGKVIKKSSSIAPPPRKVRKPNYPPPTRTSASTPNTNSNAYAVPNLSYLSVDIKDSTEDNDHSYEEPSC